MRRLQAILRQRRGESLAELMAASVVFLLLLATLHGAVRFSTSTLKKAEDIRANAAEVQENLRSATAEGSTSSVIVFQSVSPGGGVQGGEELFRVPVKLQVKKAAGLSGDEVEFRVYGEGSP